MKKLLLVITVCLFTTASIWAQTTDFEFFTTGTVHYQGNGSTTTSSGGYLVADPYGSLWTLADEWNLPTPIPWDEEVQDDGTGNMVWRLSNAATSSGFSNKPYSPSSASVAGESTAALWNDRGDDHTSPLSPPNARAYASTEFFHSGFKFKSATGAAQTDLSLSVSPAPRQSSIRSSYVGINDDGTGFDLTFYETIPGNSFSGSTIATGLSYTNWHEVDIFIEFVDGLNGDGTGNDIVTVMLDGTVIHTGTTWETYYVENPGSFPNAPYAADALLFNCSGTAVAGNLGNGLYFDDVTIDNTQAPGPVNVYADAALTSLVSNHATIQDAINDATTIDGYYITVAAGTYTGSVSLSKEVILLGANAGIHPAVGTHLTETVGTRGSESILAYGNGPGAISVSADNVTIDGFKITSTGQRIIDTYADADYFTLKNCIWENTSAYAPQGTIQFGGGSHTNMTIEFNEFHNGESAMLYTGGTFDNLAIQYNYISCEGDAVFWTAAPLVDGVIMGNEIDGTIGVTPGLGFCTFNIGKAGNIQVTDNWVHDVYYTAFQLGIANGSVTGNKFENIYPYNGYFGSCLELWGGQYTTTESSNVTISDNEFYYNDIAGAGYPSHAIRLRAPDGGSGIDGSTIHVNNNEFYNGNVRTDAYTIWDQSAQIGTVDATCNWFADASTPTVFEAPTFNGPANYIPYSISPGGACNGGLPIATNIELPTPVSCDEYDVDITVEAFNEVGAISLNLNFDDAVLDYQGITVNSAISNQSVVVSNGTLFFGWFDVTNNGITLNDGDILFTLHFDLLPAISGNTTALTWSTDPGSCEYAGPGGSPVYTSNFNDLSWTIPVRPVKNLNTSFEYCTIQSAIDDATAGDEIQAAAGIYPEGLTIDRSISLYGPNKNISPNTGTRDPEAILQPPGGVHAILSAANGITVSMKGFIVDMVNAGIDERFLEQVAKPNTTWTFENNIFKNAKECGTGNWRLTGVLNTGLVFNLIDNYFTNNEASNGISIWDAPFTATIKDNVWEDNGAWALNLNQVSGTIENNTFIDTDPNVPDNVWYNNQCGLIIAADNNDVEIINNTFINNYSSINIYGNTEGTLDIYGNFFEDNIDYAIKLRDLVTPGALTFSANTNSFTGVASGGFAIINQTIGYSADANCNWFETIDQSVIAGLVDGDVDFVPFLIDGTDGLADPGFQPATGCDEELPVITCPANLTVSLDDDKDPYATGYASATDNSGTVVVTYDDDISALISCNTTGDIVRTWTAADLSGNVASCVQTVTVIDDIDPIVVVPADITQDTDPGLCSAVVTYDETTATDLGHFQGFEDVNWENTAGSSTDWNNYQSTLTRVTSGTNGIISKTESAHGVANSTALPPAPDDYSGIFTRLGGYSSVYGNGYVVSIDVYFDLTDLAVAADTYGWDVSVASSNQSGSHLRDFIFHTASNPLGNIYVAASNNTNFTRRNDLASINHYEITSSGWYTLEWDFRDFGDGSLAVDCNLRDASGSLLWTETRNNSSDLLATVVGGNRYMWFTFLEVDNLAIDNTKLVRKISTSSTPASGSTFAKGDNTVTASATDACGNTGTNSFTITVEDNESPTITCPADVTVHMNSGCEATGVNLGTPITGDNCGVASVSNDAVEPFIEGTTVVTWTVIDDSGNPATCTQNVTVVSNDLDGALTYHNGGQTLSNVPLTLTDGTDTWNTSTDLTGLYSFPNLCAGTYTITADLSGKPVGGINATDAAMVNYWFTGAWPIEKVRFFAGDVDNNENIVSGDAQQILAYFVTNGSSGFNAGWSYWKSGDVVNANPQAYDPLQVTIGGGDATIDLLAMVNGDFNMSYSGASKDGSVELIQGEKLLTEVGSSIGLPLYANSSMEVGATSLILNYPSDLMEIENVYLQSDPNQPIMFSANAGELRIGWTSLDAIAVSEGEALLTVQVKVLDEPGSEGMTLTLASDPLNELADGSYNVISNASLTVNVLTTIMVGMDELYTSDLRLANHPNPFNTSTTITYTLPVSGKVSLEIYDLLGNKVITLVDEMDQRAGQQQVKLESGILQPGVYTANLRLSHDSKLMSKTIKLISR